MDGDGGGFDTFFTEDYPKLVAYLVMLGFGRETAKDAAKEAMTELFAAWETVRFPRTWARTTARRKAVKAAKAVSKEAAQLPEHELLASDRDWESTVELKVSAEAAIRALPAKQQVVMALTLEGYTPREIAEALGCRADQVRANLAHARRALRRMLDRHGEW